MTKVIGIIGGIGSGKSAVSSVFVQNGAAVLDADRAGRRLLESDDVKNALFQRFGFDVFIASDRSPQNQPIDQTQSPTILGDVDRKKLAKLVFAQSDEGRRNLDFLNRLTHPKIADALQNQLNEFQLQKKEIVILDAPLILEASWDKITDYIVFVDADQENRWKRVQQRNWSRRDFENREAAQTSLLEKKSRADFIIDNNQTWNDMVSQVEAIVQKIRRA